MGKYRTAMSGVFNAGGNKSKQTKVIDGIVQMISEKKLRRGDPLPSVNYIIAQTGFARMTVVKALNELKKNGVIESKNRIGYFVGNRGVDRQLKVMLFLTSFDSYHEILYKEIISGLESKNIGTDLFFHHCNPDVFRAVIKEHVGLYGLYLVTCFQHPSVKKVLNEIPKHKLLQIIRPPALSDASYISQRFDDELINALLQASDRIKKYDCFRLIFPPGRGFPEEIKDSFSRVCDAAGIYRSTETVVEKEMIRKGSAFLVITDNDLIKVVKFSEEAGYKIGTDIGIISYNETPMKEIIRNGITVVSTDFRQMGIEIRQFVETQQFVQKNIPTKVIIRNSL